MSRTEENLVKKLSFAGPVAGLRELVLSDFKNSAGRRQQITISFQIFGPEIGNAPVVLVNHTLTGNSQVTGENGWWKEVVGPGKTIDTDHYTILAIDMPGNGFTGNPEHLIHNYREFTLHDYARMYVRVLDVLGIDHVFAAIGGSIGGALAWEIAVYRPDLIKHLIPIASDYKATDWVLAHCKVQDQILNNSVTPVQDARQHAMTFYRTPQSFTQKFRRSKNENLEFNIHSWLSHHGEKLEKRFQLASYKLMNHLLTTMDISAGTGQYLDFAAKIEGDIHIVTIDSDSFFLAEENWETYVELSLFKNNISINEIKSVHGHDAFLIEDTQLSRFLKPIFQQEKLKNEENKYRPLWNG